MQCSTGWQKSRPTNQPTNQPTDHMSEKPFGQLDRPSAILQPSHSQPPSSPPQAATYQAAVQPGVVGWMRQQRMLQAPHHRSHPSGAGAQRGRYLRWRSSHLAGGGGEGEGVLLVPEHTVHGVAPAHTPPAYLPPGPRTHGPWCPAAERPTPASCGPPPLHTGPAGQRSAMHSHPQSLGGRDRQVSQQQARGS